jgi:hypothetical protein
MAPTPAGGGHPRGKLTVLDGRGADPPSHTVAHRHNTGPG